MSAGPVSSWMILARATAAALLALVLAPLVYAVWISFKALGEDSRVRIISLLMDAPLGVCEIAYRVTNLKTKPDGVQFPCAFPATVKASEQFPDYPIIIY